MLKQATARKILWVKIKYTVLHSRTLLLNYYCIMFALNPEPHAEAGRTIR